MCPIFNLHTLLISISEDLDEKLRVTRGDMSYGTLQGHFNDVRDAARCGSNVRNRTRDGMGFFGHFDDLRGDLFAAFVAVNINAKAIEAMAQSK
jgi:hypothetical protein